ncbi:MAG: hypothetical protein ACRD82_11210, partial [Blastocatellia bacterium]
ALDVIGEGVGNVSSNPEDILGKYDLVFARGRSALEALATGTAVILFGPDRIGSLVTAAELERLRRLNFGIRTLSSPLTGEALRGEIARYDPADATTVTAHIRATAGREKVVDELVEIYRAVIAEHASTNKPDPAAESRAASDYLRQLSPRLKDSVFQRQQLRVLANSLQNERDAYKSELDWMKNSATFRLRQLLFSWPLLLKAWRAMRRRFT